jgi:hypothetical protein
MHTCRTRYVAPLLVAGGLLLSGGASAETAQPGKAGPIMLNLKLGANIPVFLADTSRGGNTLSGSRLLDAIPAGFAMQAEFGFAVDRARNAYLLFPFEFHVGGNSAGGFTTTHVQVVLPFGFQYDIPILPGLYLYPRASMGYAAYIIAASGGGATSTQTYHGGMFTPEFGAKYVLKRRFNFGFEPFSLPIHFYKPAATVGGRTVEGDIQVLLDYRLHFYAGVNL